jgi:Leucine-rich repeat (LRR) protein
MLKYFFKKIIFFLKQLFANHNEIEGFEDLPYHTSLEYLGLAHNSIVSLKNISNLPNLRLLIITGNFVQSLEHFNVTQEMHLDSVRFE